MNATRPRIWFVLGQCLFFVGVAIALVAYVSVLWGAPEKTAIFGVGLGGLVAIAGFFVASPRPSVVADFASWPVLMDGFLLLVGVGCLKVVSTVSDINTVIGMVIGLVLMVVGTFLED